jgi:hypothetical protein
MTRKHKHHIIPVHLGGTDDPDNLIELSVEEHAEAHKNLYKKHGNEFDLIAYRGLSGQITMTEAKRLAQLEGFKRGGNIARANRNANGTSIGDWVKKTGYVRHFTKEDCFKGGSASGKLQAASPKWKHIQSLGGKVGGKIANAVMRSQNWLCVECGKVAQPNVLGWHMKKSNHVLKVRI